MIFSVHGPYNLARNHASRLIDNSANAKRTFWDNVEYDAPGLPDACGVYIFVCKAGRIALPWYVGLTLKQTFRKECLGPHQVTHYNNVIASQKGQPQIFLLSKQTSSKRYAKPSHAHADIEFLETFLFAYARKRNPDLRNDRNTKFLKHLVVPGIINTPARSPYHSEKALKEILGL